MQMCPHRIHGNVQHCCDAFVAAFILVIEHQHGALVLRQLLQRVVYAAFYLRIKHVLLWAARMLACKLVPGKVFKPRLIVTAFRGRLVYGTGALFAPPLPLILRNVQDDAIKIGGYCRVATKFRQRTIQPQKHFLREILHLIAARLPLADASRQARERAKHHCLVLAHKLFKHFRRCEVSGHGNLLNPSTLSCAISFNALDETFDAAFSLSPAVVHLHVKNLRSLMISLAFALFNNNLFDSPFVVPVAGCVMILGIVVAGMWSSNRTQELRSRERLECIARGIPPSPTVEELAIMHQGKGLAAGSLGRRRANLRLGGIILLATSAGLILFFVVLAIILQVRPVLAGAAVGLIPLAIGVGFLIDTKIQAKEIEAMESDATRLEVLK
jgi:hypothetical protein